MTTGAYCLQFDYVIFACSDYLRDFNKDQSASYRARRMGHQHEGTDEEITSENILKNFTVIDEFYDERHAPILVDNRAYNGKIYYNDKHSQAEHILKELEALDVEDARFLAIYEIESFKSVHSMAAQLGYNFIPNLRFFRIKDVNGNIINLLYL